MGTPDFAGCVNQGRNVLDPFEYLLSSRYWGPQHEIRLAVFWRLTFGTTLLS
jgi:hypothetical protein